jgi:hypothetical protein
MIWTRLAFPLLILATVVPSAHADELHTGDRVRVFTSGDQGLPAMVTGHIVSMDDEALVVLSDRTSHNIREGMPPDVESATIPRSAVTGVDRSIGKKDHLWSGLLVGTACGLTLGYVAEQADNNSDAIFTVNQPAYLIIGGGLGAATGAFVGQLLKSEQWAPVDRTSFSVTSGNRGTAISLDFNF